MKLLIAIVCLDDIGRLKNTLDSLLTVDCYFEVFIKDCCSASSSDIKDLSMSYSDKLFIHFLSRKDSSIYDGMNEAIDWVF